MMVEAEQMAKRMRGHFLDVVFQVDQSEVAQVDLMQRLDRVLVDARPLFQGRLIDRTRFEGGKLVLHGPVPWTSGVMVQIEYKEPRRTLLVEVLNFLAAHSAWDGLTGTVTRAPWRQSGADQPPMTAMVAGMRVKGRELLGPGHYPRTDPPADLRPLLLDVMLDWAGLGGADRVYISTWYHDHRVAPERVRAHLELALAWTSDIAVVTVTGGVYRRVAFLPDCVFASLSCTDNTARESALEDFTRLIERAPELWSYAAAKRASVIVTRWHTFLATGPTSPPFTQFWNERSYDITIYVPDAYPFQLLGPAHPLPPLTRNWEVTDLSGGYRLVRAIEPEPWFGARGPEPATLAAARAELDILIARTNDPA